MTRFLNLMPDWFIILGGLVMLLASPAIAAGIIAWWGANVIVRGGCTLATRRAT